MYRAGTSSETGAWDRVLAILSVKIVSTSTFLSWFDPAEACWAFLQEWEFDTIVAELKQVIQMFNKGSMICKTFD